jgi:hypothetical protein
MPDKHCTLEEAWDEDGTVWDRTGADDLTIEHAKCTIEMMGNGTPKDGDDPASRTEWFVESDQRHARP